MKNLLSLAVLVFCLSACAAPQIELLPPPLKDPPLHRSVKVHKGEQGEPRFCLDRPDYEATQECFENVRNVKKHWGR
jgi:hypothetical protein